IIFIIKIRISYFVEHIGKVGVARGSATSKPAVITAKTAPTNPHHKPTDDLAAISSPHPEAALAPRQRGARDRDARDRDRLGRVDRTRTGVVASEHVARGGDRPRVDAAGAGLGDGLRQRVAALLRRPAR